MFHSSPFARSLYLACCAAICCISFSLTAHAQQPSLPSLPPLPPAKSASEPSAMERSKRQSDNVYKFIKQFADTPRKPDAAPARPRVEAVAAPAPVRRPDTQNVATPAPATRPQPDAAPEATTAGTTPSPPAQASSAPAAVATPEPTAAPATPAVAAVEEEDEELELITQVQPEVARGMRGGPDTGKVTVALTVQPDGSVSEATVVTTSHRRFGKPARDAVAQWRFAPIKVARTVQVEIAFDLR